MTVTILRTDHKGIVTRQPVTPSLSRHVSKYNTYLSPREVLNAWRYGRTVYTTFGRYELAA